MIFELVIVQIMLLYTIHAQQTKAYNISSEQSVTPLLVACKLMVK